MALTPQVQASQAGVTAVTEASPVLKLSQAGVMAVAIWPAQYARASQAGLALVGGATTTMKISQAGVMVVARGRVTDPRILAWSYTLDGHEVLVLRLGNQETLAYDFATAQWSVFGSGTSSLWRAYDGGNWIDAGPVAALGSNVIVGDDGNGALYVLDPDGDYDDDALSGGEIPRPFTRRAIGQVLVREGYKLTQCFAAELFGSAGAGDDGLTVQLEYSDDRGHSYVDAGTVMLGAEDWQARVQWRSLGSIRAPGRLFRITDTGALKRIDAMNMKP